MAEQVFSPGTARGRDSIRASCSIRRAIDSLASIAGATAAPSLAGTRPLGLADGVVDNDRHCGCSVRDAPEPDRSRESPSKADQESARPSASSLSPQQADQGCLRRRVRVTGWRWQMLSLAASEVSGAEATCLSGLAGSSAP